MDIPYSEFFADQEQVNQGKHCIFITQRVQDVFIIFMYKSPKYSSAKFLAHLKKYLDRHENELAVFVGDINIDMWKQENKFVDDAFNSSNFRSALDLTWSSTGYGSHIDICYTNHALVKASYYESLFSYHKPICITFPRLHC